MRKSFRFAAADEQQALGLQAAGTVEHHGLEDLAGDLAGGDELGSGILERLVSRGDAGSGLSLSPWSRTGRTRHSVSSCAGEEKERLVFIVFSSLSLVVVGKCIPHGCTAAARAKMRHIGLPALLARRDVAEDCQSLNLWNICG